MPPTTRRTTPATDAPATDAPVPATTAPHEGERVTLRLPLLTVSVSRPPAGGTADQGAAASSGASPELPRWLFYGGVAALGAAGLVDWPVAAAIAAGAWLTGRVRGTPGDRG
jgi:hypothetical protein